MNALAGATAGVEGVSDFSPGTSVTKANRNFAGLGRLPNYFFQR